MAWLLTTGGGILVLVLGWFFIWPLLDTAQAVVEAAVSPQASASPKDEPRRGTARAMVIRSRAGEGRQIAELRLTPAALVIATPGSELRIARADIVLVRRAGGGLELIWRTECGEDALTCQIDDLDRWLAELA